MTQDMTVKARYEADVRGYQASMQAAAASTEKLAQAADRAGKATETASQAAEKAASRVATAQEKATRAQERAADAAGRLRAAQAQLDSARDSGKVQALVTAEERVAKAQRDVETTARQAAAAHAEHVRAISDAEAAAKRLGDEMEATGGKTSRVFDGLRKNSADLQEVGSGLATVGATLMAAAGGSAKAAMDWESAFTGVKKTVDDTTEGYAQLEDELRGLATTLPTTHQEVAAVAEAAGQLGVAREDIVGFTKTMIDLGESTNLTADEAATQIAQISNVMGTMEREGTEGVARFGGTLVALGNAGASTEADILAMAQRISGAGATVGATEADVLALSNTLSSMGVKAELGGGVTTRVLLKMKASVESGGASLEAFARTAGVSADEFSAKFKSSPVQALDLVAQGISRVNTEGGATTQTLKDMGMKGTEEAQVMLALAASGDLLTESLKLGKEAWDENTASNALATEAHKRYEDSASKVKIAWNQIKDAAIDAGADILPVVVDIMGGVADMVGAFQDLPGPVKGALGVLTGLGGVALTAAGGFMMLAPKVLETKDALARLTGKASAAPVQIDAVGVAAERSTRKLTPFGKAVVGVGKALGGLATAATVGITIGSLVPSGEAAEADRLAAAVTRIGTGGEQAALGIDELNKAFTGKGNWFDGLDVDGIDEAFRIMGNPNVADNVDQIASKVLTFGTRSSTNVEFAKKNFEALDQQLASMAQGGSLDAAKTSFDQLAEKAKAQGVSQERLNELFPAYASALSRADAEAQAAAQSTGDLAVATGDLGAAGEEASVSLGALESIDASGMEGVQSAMDALSDETLEFGERLDAVMNALSAMGLHQQSAAQAAAGYEAALDGLSSAVEENGRTLDITTEAGRKNQDALFGIADAGRALMTASAEAGASQGELRGQLQGTYKDLVAAGEQMGLTSADARTLAQDILGIPGGVDIETWMDNSAMVMAEATTGAIEAIPGYKGVAVAVSEEGTAGTVQSRIDEITGKTEYVWVDDAGTSHTVQQEIRSIAGVERTVWVDDDGTVYATQRDINAVTGKVVDVRARPTGIASTEEALNWTARDREAIIRTKYIQTSVGPAKNHLYGQSGPFFGLPKNSGGGIASLPGYSSGGVLPRTGLGTDMILGVTGEGRPIARVDDGEMVVNRKSTEQYARALHLINQDAPSVRHLKGYAAGGTVGREWSARAVTPVVNVAAPTGGGVDTGALVNAVVAGVAALPPTRLEYQDREVARMVRGASRFAEGR